MPGQTVVARWWRAYRVVVVSSRGSTGDGGAFSRAIDRAYPSVDYNDLIGGVDAVVAQG